MLLRHISQIKLELLRVMRTQYIRSANFTMNKPSIVILTNYHRVPQDAKSSRRNLFIRDKFTCQYCFNEFQQQELTIDHVSPPVLRRGNVVGKL